MDGEGMVLLLPPERMQELDLQAKRDGKDCSHLENVIKNDHACTFWRVHANDLPSPPDQVRPHFHHLVLGMPRFSPLGSWHAPIFTI
jgi:hypothetical protein